MSGTDGGGEWFTAAWIWDVVKYCLAAVSTAASATLLWLGARYKGDRSMLLRHEERLNDADKELGDAKIFRHEITRSLEAQMDALQKEDDTLHLRVNKLELANSERNGDIKAINENLAWIKKSLERIEKK